MMMWHDSFAGFSSGGGAVPSDDGAGTFAPPSPL